MIDRHSPVIRKQLDRVVEAKNCRILGISGGPFSRFLESPSERMNAWLATQW
jgi:hypothetical protein